MGWILLNVGGVLGGQILHQAIATPILYDFYNYDVEKKEFNQLFVKFTQVIEHHEWWIIWLLQSKRWHVLGDTIVAESGIVGSIAVLHRHEELDSKETSREEESQIKNIIDYYDESAEEREGGACFFVVCRTLLVA